MKQPTEEEKAVLQTYHQTEADRIQRELDELGPEFAEDGIVRMVLRNRIAQERRLAEGEIPCES
jgi:hypothetical protein